MFETSVSVKRQFLNLPELGFLHQDGVAAYEWKTDFSNTVVGIFAEGQDLLIASRWNHASWQGLTWCWPTVDFFARPLMRI